jgi:hypothetical protein
LDSDHCTASARGKSGYSGREEEEHRFHERKSMAEHHRIVGEPRGEPLPAGRIGVRVRIPLSGCPSRRWSRNLSARLSNELVGHAAVGHLRLNDIVQGDELVLEGVEGREAPALADALRRAVDATNRTCATDPEQPANTAPVEADQIAHGIAIGPS